MNTVAVVGLGLIGGSLARDLAAQGVRVLGYDRDAATLRAALADGALAGALGPELERVEDADALVLAVPVGAARGVLAAVRSRLDDVALITDAGSTKRSVVAAAEALGLGGRFVGAHPLAGDHRSGWAASRTGLFRGARVFLCPAPASSARAHELAHRLWSGVGGQTEWLDAEAHDRLLAWSSHLPQLASTALALALSDARIPARELGPGGRDATRLAGSSPEMWADIALDNAPELAEAVDALASRLADLGGVLRAGDHAAIHARLAAGRTWRSGSTPENA